MLDFLKGKKTYILAAAGGVIIFGYILGWIDSTVANVLLGLLGFGGLATLRAAIK
jgi:hypothetical protein